MESKRRFDTLFSGNVTGDNVFALKDGIRLSLYSCGVCPALTFAFSLLTCDVNYLDPGSQLFTFILLAPSTLMYIHTVLYYIHLYTQMFVIYYCYYYYLYTLLLYILYLYIVITSELYEINCRALPDLFLYF